ncbi:TerD family protein [Pantoea sp. Ae16]|uniref:TerD family protein n=1 Tax=Pantoea sp. Ae16 TaxID=1890373 RepID=UPI00352ABFF1
MTTGQNFALNNTCPELCLTWKTRSGFSSDIDASAFLLGADEKVLGDSSMIFFNQPHNENRSIVMHCPSPSRVSLSRWLSMAAIQSGVYSSLFCSVVNIAMLSHRAIYGRRP